VRLRYAYILKCERAIKDASGAVTELRCTYDADSLNGPTATRRSRGRSTGSRRTNARAAEVRLYDRLFLSEDPAEGGRDPLDDLNPKSLERIEGAKVEPALAEAASGTRFQFERRATSASIRTRAKTSRSSIAPSRSRDSWAKIQNRSR